jgi:hypothetical protein
MKSLKEIFRFFRPEPQPMLGPQALFPRVSIVDFELKYYSDVFVENKSRKNIRDADDCIDFVLMYERDHRQIEIWPQLALLYKICMDYLKCNTSISDDPIMGQGRYVFDLVRLRYEYKQQILRGYAKRNGFVIV